MENLKNKAYHLLRKSEGIFKTDMIYLAKGGLWLTIGQVFASFSSFVLAIAFANLLPQEVYGIYKYVISAFPLIAISTLSGLGPAATQSISRGFDGTLKLVITSRVKWAIVGTMASLAIAIYYFYNENLILTYSFILIGIFVPLFETLGTYDSALQGKKRFDVSNKYFIASQTFASISILISLFFTKNVIFILAAYFTSWTLARGFFLYKTMHEHIVNTTIDPQAISNGRHLSFLSAFGTVANYLDRILIFTLMGASQLAIYSIATAPVDQIKSLITRGASSLAYPKFAGMTGKELNKSIFQHTTNLTIVSVLLSLLYMASASFLFKIVFPQYLAAIPYSIGYALILMPLAYILPTSAMSAVMAKKELYIFNISSAIFQITILFAGVVTAGIWGLIFARIISKFFDWIISLILIRRLG